MISVLLLFFGQLTQLGVFTGGCSYLHWRKLATPAQAASYCLPTPASLQSADQNLTPNFCRLESNGVPETDKGPKAQHRSWKQKVMETKVFEKDPFLHSIVHVLYLI